METWYIYIRIIYTHIPRERKYLTYSNTSLLFISILDHIIIDLLISSRLSDLGVGSSSNSKKLKSGLMETLVVVDQNRNQYYGKRRAHGSPSSRAFREINCRTFQSGAGILPTPVKVFTPVSKRGFGVSPSSPLARTPSSPSVNISSEEKTNSRTSKRTTLKKSSSVPIPINIKVDSDKEKSLFSDEFSYPELWAGPAYSNSPPPSSLPIPKFFVPPKRSVSLELTASSVSDIDLHLIARSAPPSPKREYNNSARSLFHSADFTSATNDLRRILNLEMTDE